MYVYNVLYLSCFSFWYCCLYIETFLKKVFYYCILSFHVGISNTTEKVMLENKEKEEKLQTALESQHEHFSRLMVAVRSALDHKLQHQQLVLVDFIRWIEHRMNWVGELGNIDDLNELFKKLHPHFDFLDCKLIVDMSEMFLNNEYFGEDKSLVSELKEHMVSAKSLRSLSTVKQLKNDLKKIYFPYQSNLANMPHIQIELHNPWYEANIEALYLLIGHLLPHKSKQSILKYIEIDTGSVCIKYFVHESKVDCLIAYAQDKLQFMRIIGIFGLTINGEPVLKEDENMNFSFELALLEAAKTGHDEAVQFLLKLGGNIDYCNKEGRTALMLASEEGCEQVVQTLVSAGSNVNIQDNNGYTSLMLACDTNSYTIVNYLLQAGANPDIQNDACDTAIIIACQNIHADIVELLLQFNADPLITCRNEDTAFTVATHQNSIEIVEMLLEHLPESQKTSAVTSALTTACQYGHSQTTVNLLVKLLDIFTPEEFQLFVSCAEGDHDTTKSHIYDTDVNINCTLVNGITPLMIASSCGHTETVQVLLQAGANVNSTDNDGYSSLVYAITGHKSLQVIEQLLKAGAQPKVFIDNQSIADKAEGREDICKLLQHFHVVKIKKSEEEVLEQLLKICDSFTILNTTILSSLQKLITEGTVLLVDVIGFLYHYLGDTELKVDNIDQLFNVLQPHYYFLNLDLPKKIMDKFFGGKLQNRLQDYIGIVKVFEESTQLQLFREAMKHVPLLQPPVTTTRTCTMVIKFHEQWQHKRVAHMNTFLNYSFSKETHFLNHIVIEEVGSACVCKFVVPKSQLDSLRVIAVEKREFMNQVGVYEVYVGDQPILIEDYNCSFSFRHVLQNSIEAEDDKLALFLMDIDVTLHANNSLHEAARDGNIDAIELLLKKHVDINVDDKNGVTALMLASGNGHTQVIELLLKKHPDINLQAKNGVTALMLASLNGHIQIVDLLLKEHANINTQEEDGWTALMLVSQKGYHQVVELLLKEHADINLQAKNGLAALMLASDNGHLKIVELLLKHHVDVNIQNEDGWTALMLATLNCHHQVVELLLKEHANVNIQDKNRVTALMLASHNGHYKIFEALLKEHADINHQGKDGVTALMLASLSSHHQVVELLLKNHANIDTQEEDGWTALMLASQNGYHKVVDLLLKEHANINLQDKNGLAALMLASHNGHYKVVELLLKEYADINLQAKNGHTALMLASRNGHSQVVELLLKEHADVNIQKKDGWTALMLASFNGHHQVVELLLKKHANINHQGKDGVSTLMLASQNGHYHVVELLLKEHANANLQDKNGTDALMLASHNGHYKIVELLLKEHANINLQDKNGHTALMLGSQNGHLQVVKLLLKERANINLQTKDGFTALMLATQIGHLQVIELLLKEHANVNIQKEDGWTALMLASQNGHIQIVKLLLNEHANINTQNKNGLNALMIAAFNGHTQVVKLLLQWDADVSILSEDDYSALMVASQNGHLEIVECLLQSQVDPYLLASDGSRAFSLAAYSGNRDLVNMLLEKVKPTTDEIEEAVVLSCLGGHPALITFFSSKLPHLTDDHRELLYSCVKGDLGTVVMKTLDNPDTPLVLGLTPLMVASSCGHAGIVNALIQAGADVNKQESNWGFTPLFFAVRGSKSFTIVKTLLERNANPNVIADKRTLLDEAIDIKQESISDLLSKYGGQTRAQLEGTKENKPNSSLLAFNELNTSVKPLQPIHELTKTLTCGDSYTIQRETKQKKLQIPSPMSILHSFTPYILNPTRTFRNTSVKQDNKKEVKEVYTVSIN